MKNIEKYSQSVQYNAVSAANWDCGNLTLTFYPALKIAILSGGLTHTTSAAPAWGESVCTFNDVDDSTPKYVPVLLYSTRGNIYSTMVLTIESNNNRVLKTYSPDNTKLVNANESFHVHAAF